jgi:hypothetical protein
MESVSCSIHSPLSATFPTGDLMPTKGVTIGYTPTPGAARCRDASRRRTYTGTLCGRPPHDQSAASMNAWSSPA